MPNIHRPWAASDAADDESGIVRLFDHRDDLVAELTPEQARDLGTELRDVASYVSPSERSDAEHVLAEFEAFNAKCEAAEYTDTGDAWAFLNALADALRTAIREG